MKQILRKTLLVLVAGVMSTAAWAGTIDTMGSNDAGWGTPGSYHDYTLAPNKTLTLTFTVASTKGENSTQGFFINIPGKLMVQPNGGFNINDVWWPWGEEVKYDRSWTDLDEALTFLPGATVELTIKRVHQQVLYFADITTTSSERKYLRVLTKDIFDENTNILVSLGADYAVLTGITDVTTDESIKGTLIGKEDNSVDFNGDGAVNQAFTLGTGKSLTLNFINYSSKIGNGDNWYIRIQNGEKYLDLRSDFFGSEGGMVGDEHYFVRTEDNTKPAYFTLSSSTGLYFDNFPKALHKANVNLTVARSGSTITITAAQTCTNSEVKTQIYTLTHDDFASGDVTVRLYAAWSHLDLLSTSQEVYNRIGATEWGTYVSEYPLDFTGYTDVKAYKVTGRTSTAIVTEQLTGIVPANTPMLLNAQNGAALYTIPVAASAGSSVGDNCLKTGTGAAVSQDGAYDRYVLINNSGTAVFKKIGSKSATVATNRAYLEFTAGAGSRDILYLDGGDVTAIKNLKVGAEENIYFNLQGQRVLYPTKGLYIVNGKKVIIK